MKKKVILLFMMGLLTVPLCASSLMRQKLALYCVIKNQHNLGQPARSMAAPVYVYQEEHTIYFENSKCFTINLFDNGELVYSDITDNGIVILPTSLCGDYTLEIERNGTLYRTELYLPNI